MNAPKHLDVGETSARFYVGHHLSGIGLIPMGDRNRASIEFLDEVSSYMWEERNNGNQYDKYLKSS